MLRTHSAVYQGKHHRSYHDTTIQLVQPLPSMTLDQLNVTRYAMAGHLFQNATIMSCYVNGAKQTCPKSNGGILTGFLSHVKIIKWMSSRSSKKR